MEIKIKQINQNCAQEINKIKQFEPLVYILILNWNGWQDTLECIRSVKELNYNNYKIVVMDNNSSDNSVAEITKAYPDISLIQNESNLGFAEGNNRGKV